ncbi:hypothetical protein FRB96_004189 [Tulasnella sp. 330]|nr:hypothetical protein FRB96_004189 [Tulasnella sp. 330]KAG8873384.1 hypothetical protein FRB97_006793 [Tulasnella sp. 331]
MLTPKGYLFLSLNAVRTLSIIALLLVFSSNIFILVEDIKAVKAGSSTLTSTNSSGQTETFECDYFDNSTVPNQPAGVFWAVVNRLFIIVTSIVLILSEIGWPDRFFENYLPILGHKFGVGILGTIQWITAASILSHHVDDFPLVAGFFLFVVGCFNIIIGLIFRDSVKDKRSTLTFRLSKNQGLPISAPKVLVTANSSIFGNEKGAGGPLVRSDTSGSSYSNETGQFHKAQQFGAGYGFARQGEKQAAHAGYMVTRPVDSLPRYHPRPPTSVESDADDEDERPERPVRI